jgi:ribosome-associated translation inhibitor RaiA
METTLQVREQIPHEIITSLVLNGDLGKMEPEQRVEYYTRFCNSLGLNHLTQPFQLITFQGKLRLYATKDCTEQLRRIYGVSVTSIKSERVDDVFVVTVNVQDRTGRTDAATGAVVVGNLKGEALANALMKAETKAKRRATLSICGLGMLDESETDTIGTHTVQPVVPEGYVPPQRGAMPRDSKAERSAGMLEKINEDALPANQNVEILMATTRQKAEVLLLLNNELVTKEEKEKMIASINKLDRDRAEKAIEKLKKTIATRQGGPRKEEEVA